MVVGEFNSGKSSVINALLGSAVLEEGILPTTNEISVLKHTTGEAAVERVRTGAGIKRSPNLPVQSRTAMSCASAIQNDLCHAPHTAALIFAAEWRTANARGYGRGFTRACGVQTEDGLYQRRLPAELLRKVNIVDTPGTNVIVERQQRLTEEFVPRSDLVLFILSADRPFTESEVRRSRGGPCRHAAACACAGGCRSACGTVASAARSGRCGSERFSDCVPLLAERAAWPQSSGRVVKRGVTRVDALPALQSYARVSRRVLPAPCMV